MISGKGTLDFGANDAVIACSGSRTTTLGGYPAEISAAIAGSGTVTFAAPFAIRYVGLVLSGANTYTGDTYVSDVQMYVRSDTAFGTGKVTVLGGGACGGQLCFDKDGLTVANDLEVSGYGPHHIASYTSEHENGSIWFRRDATLTGNVRVNGYTRFGSYDGASIMSKISGTGTFTGVISGGSVQLLRNSKPVVYTGANTYTGGTEIVQSTLILRGPCSAGTGEVAVDNGGVLRFENTSSVTFPNRLEGLGTVQLAGSAPVTFSSTETRTDDRLVLDLAGTAQTFPALPPFSTITNTSDTVATITLAENLGTVSWDGRTLNPANKIEFAIGEGTALDLGGDTLTVRRMDVASRNRVVNGTVVETNPRRGLTVIFY